MIERERERKTERERKKADKESPANSIATILLVIPENGWCEGLLSVSMPKYIG